MKDKIINLKNKVVEFLKIAKDKIFTFIMANKKLSIIAGVILIIIILGIIILYNNKTETGNTSGNLNNLGFSVKVRGWVYYLGLNDSVTDGIYKVKANSDKKEKISSDYALYLNISGNYLYYLDITSGNCNIVRMKTNGENKETLIEDVDTAKVTVVDNWIYYFKGSNFYKVKTNGEKKQVLSKKSIYNYEIDGSWIYYSYINDGKYVIAKMKTDGSDITKLDTDASEVFFVNSNYIYYIYENYDEEELEYKYELYRVKTNGEDKNKITDIDGDVQLDYINFDDNRIYYTKVDDNDVLSIYSIKVNGKDEKKIVDIQGYSTMMNIQKNWIYYTDQNDDGDSEMFRVKINGEDKQSLSI